MGRFNKINKKRPLIVICSEGGNITSERVYFSNFRNRNLRIQFSTGNSTDPKGMVEDLLKYIKNEDIKSEDECTIFLIIDTDLDDKRIEKIKNIKPICDVNNINIITSAPTFEIWYLMHYKKDGLKFNSSQEVKKAMTKITKDKYNENMNVFPLINKNINKAYEQSKKINELSLKNNQDIIYINPHTDIYKIIDKINYYQNKLK